MFCLILQNIADQARFFHPGADCFLQLYAITIRLLKQKVFKLFREELKNGKKTF